MKHIQIAAMISLLWINHASASEPRLCPADRPCWSGTQDCHTVVFGFDHIGGWEYYNVRYATVGGGVAQVESHNGFFTIDNAWPNATYSISVQGCNSGGIFESSSCSPWSETSVTTGGDWGRCNPGGQPVYLTNQQSGRVLDAEWTQRTTDGGKVILWDRWNGPNQLWYLTTTGEIRTYDSYKCLDADLGTIATNGTTVQLWSCNGGLHQKWRRNEDGTITNAHSGRCLDADLGSIWQNGTRMLLWDCHGGPNQKWSF